MTSWYFQLLINTPLIRVRWGRQWTGTEFGACTRRFFLFVGAHYSQSNRRIDSIHKNHQLDDCRRQKSRETIICEKRNQLNELRQWALTLIDDAFLRPDYRIDNFCGGKESSGRAAWKWNSTIAGLWNFMPRLQRESNLHNFDVKLNFLCHASVGRIRKGPLKLSVWKKLFL